MSRYAARALIFNKSDELLLVRDSERYWYTPGGGLSGRETAVEGLLREIHEETGLKIRNPRFLFAHEYLREEGDRSISLWFLARTSAKLPEHWSDIGGPIVEARFFSRNQMPEIRPRFLRDEIWRWRQDNFRDVPRLVTDS